MIDAAAKAIYGTTEPGFSEPLEYSIHLNTSPSDRSTPCTLAPAMYNPTMRIASGSHLRSITGTPPQNPSRHAPLRKHNKPAPHRNSNNAQNIYGTASEQVVVLRHPPGGRCDAIDNAQQRSSLGRAVNRDLNKEIQPIYNRRNKGARNDQREQPQPYRRLRTPWHPLPSLDRFFSHAQQ